MIVRLHRRLPATPSLASQPSSSLMGEAKTMDIINGMARQTASHHRRTSPTAAAAAAHRVVVIVCIVMCIAAQSIGTASAEDFPNTPPSLYFDRNWKISELEKPGTVITRVQALDSPNDVLTFGIEANRGFGGAAFAQDSQDDSTPFRIDPNTGVVYLNESLVGRGGQMFNIYVTVSDGQLNAKVEVPVTIVRANSKPSHSGGGYRPGMALPPSFHPNASNVTNLFPAFSSLPGVTGSAANNNKNPNQRPNPFQSHTYPRPLNGYSEPAATEIGASGATGEDSAIVDAENGSNTTTGGGVNRYNTNNNNPNSHNTNHNDGAGDHQVHTYQPFPPPRDPTTTNTTTTNTSSASDGTASPHSIQLSLAIVLSICGLVIVAATMMAVYMCRQSLCAFGRTLKKRSKEEMAKKSNASTIVSGTSSFAGTEDSRNSMVLQNWTGPTAFSNRYVPWERDNQHVQATSQLSTSSSATANSQLKSDRWEFPRHRLKFFNVLGQGAFGLVWRCEATDIDGNEGITVVAVKTLKENASDIEIKDLSSELQVMKTLEPHVNVVRLLGCCTEKDPIFVILEYVNRGKLQDYLRNSRAERHYGNTHAKSNVLTSGDLTSFMYQVARGMEYLSMKGIIHRDLAARNILITDDHTCKVADFGFARDVITSKVYERKSEGKLPIRWMAIESLYDDIFSVKSDIWSFGILMWEIVTLGSTPYPGISAADVMRKVRDGYRLEKPEHCRRELYNIMYYCWSKDFNERPGFTELVSLLDKLMVTETDYIELERFPDHNYYNMQSLSGEKL